MKKIYSLKSFLLMGLLALTLIENGCKKSSDDSKVLPVIFTMSAIANVTSTTAQSGGEIYDYGTAASITSDGVCWSSSSQTPTTSDSHTSDTTTTYSYTSNLTGLTAGTTYYVRAYAISSAGTSYGSVVKFTTPTANASTIATVTTFAGNGTAGFVNSTGTNAQFDHPQGIAADAQGNLYVADAYNHVIRKITPAGVVSTFAGDGNLGYATGAAATAEFYNPQGLAVDASGTVYVSDPGNNVIYKIANGVVSLLAGKAGYSGATAGTGNTALFNSPQGITVDGSGNVYVADRNNNRIRKITTAGVVTTISGITPNGYIEGYTTTESTTGPYAELNSPSSVAVDASGVVYVADYDNHAIRKISTDHFTSQFIGNPIQKTFVTRPVDIKQDASGNFFIVNSNGTIQEVTTGNILKTIAGTADVYGFADGTNTGAKFNSPYAVTTDASGNIYIADQLNNRIRKITLKVTP
ncbi:hypothetical protein HH214_12865 [Mucilaginibacter robiniae]|uniref:Fibronectin type-III domain-containing protein n=1 Tax=Mucilaginibacter robiniae TaxID=2728022 RepID=A0A7L5E005_9SPHI|nr:hypothetical protein [Mucilaginibacter robiniae]QJD96700.1 hypothetical protein HH214_12865 [Mucilaginibacter robiniae]